MNRLRVAVLMGGISSERAISLSTGRQIVVSLNPAIYEVVALDPASAANSRNSLPPSAPISALKSADPDHRLADLVPLSLSEISEETVSGKPDVAFIALHGRGGEDGAIQGLLETLGIPYTGSGILASALAINKAMTKKVLRSESIPVPADILLKKSDGADSVALVRDFSCNHGYPVVIKPNKEGSTIGISIVKKDADIQFALEEAFKFDADVLVEQYVQGTEITVGLLGNENPEVLPLIEIVPKGEFYDYESKYEPGGSTHIIPARISETAAELARDYAIRTHVALGCRGMSRVDMIVAGDAPSVLEVNTIPGMTPTSLLPDAAKAAGIDFSELLDRLIGYALA